MAHNTTRFLSVLTLIILGGCSGLIGEKDETEDGFRREASAPSDVPVTYTGCLAAGAPACTCDQANKDLGSSVNCTAAAKIPYTCEKQKAVLNAAGDAVVVNGKCKPGSMEKDDGCSPTDAKACSTFFACVSTGDSKGSYCTPSCWCPLGWAPDPACSGPLTTHKHECQFQGDDACLDPYTLLPVAAGTQGTCPAGSLCMADGNALRCKDVTKPAPAPTLCDGKYSVGTTVDCGECGTKTCLASGSVGSCAGSSASNYKCGAGTCKSDGSCAAPPAPTGPTTCPGGVFKAAQSDTCGACGTRLCQNDLTWAACTGIAANNGKCGTNQHCASDGSCQADAAQPPATNVPCPQFTPAGSTGTSGESCATAGKEAWRCVLSQTFGSYVSQVCRCPNYATNPNCAASEMVWLTYHTKVNAATCSSCCQIGFSSACN